MRSIVHRSVVRDILNIVTNFLSDIHRLLTETASASEVIPTAALRQWRSDLVRASVSISYAINVLSLDIEVLNHSLTSSSEDVVQALVDDLPGMLASGWEEGGWTLSPDAFTSTATELEIDQALKLLDLHAEMVTSDLGDHAVVGDLLVRTKQEREILHGLRGELDDRLRGIQEAVRKQYASGVASVDDWLR